MPERNRLLVGNSELTPEAGLWQYLPNVSLAAKVIGSRGKAPANFKSEWNGG